MLPSRGAVRSAASAVRRTTLTGQLASSRGYATSHIGRARHARLPIGASLASPLVRLRSGAIAGSVAFGQIPSGSRALSALGPDSKKPDPPAAQTPPPPAETTTTPAAAAEAPAQAAAIPPQPAAPDVAAAADTASATQSSGGWSLWNVGAGSKTPAELASQAEPSATAAAVADPAATSTLASPEVIASDLSAIISSDLDKYGSISAIPENIGYLNTLGIDFGWGTTAMIQWVFEHIHVYTGLPWWGSILVTSIVIRAALWKPVMLGQEHSARLQNLRQTEPRYTKAMDAWKAAVLNKDMVANQAAKAAMKVLEKKHGVNKLLPFVSFVQIPIGFGMFRILKAMADLPVPSMETGGFLWLTDLTVPDPWYLLPMAGPLAMMATMKITNRHAAAAQQAMMKTMTYVLVPLGLFFTSFMPAGLQWYFLTTGTSGLFQTYVTFNPRFRHWVGMTPLPDPAAVVPGAPKLGFIAEMKKALNDAKEMAGTKIEDDKKKNRKKDGGKNDAQEERLQAQYYESRRERLAELERSQRMKRRP